MEGTGHTVCVKVGRGDPEAEQTDMDVDFDPLIHWFWGVKTYSKSSRMLVLLALLMV